MEAEKFEAALDAVIAHLAEALSILDEHRTGEIAAAHIVYAIDLLRGPEPASAIEPPSQRQIRP